MTVEALIKKLQKLPPKSKVTLCNDSDYKDGIYLATGIKAWKDEGEVMITTGHGRLIREMD